MHDCNTKLCMGSSTCCALAVRGDMTCLLLWGMLLARGFTGLCAGDAAGDMG